MKKLIVFIILLGVLLISILYAASTDVRYASTKVDMFLFPSKVAALDNATGYHETATTITYLFKATWADSTDQYHSRAMLIADCNDVDAYTTAIVSAASDVNIVYHFSYDNRNTWTSTTPAGYDALSNTAVTDTIGIEEAIDDADGFHMGIWLVVEMADGSTALNDDEVCTWIGTFQKDNVNTLSNGNFKAIAGLATKCETEP